MGPIKRVRNWVQTQRNIIGKSGGLEEKKQAMQRKMDVALTILREIDPAHDRRIAPQPYPEERRHAFYDYHRKLA